MIGSFLNCLIWRLHKEATILGRSFCPKCNNMIAWYDNIPVLSFFILGRRCRNCKNDISWQYPVVELITGLLFVLALYFNFGEGVEINFIKLFRDLFLIAVMIIIFIYDLRWYLILDIIVLPASLIVLIFNLFIGLNWQNLLISGIIGGSFFLLQFVVSKGKWIGGGDIRLGLLMGFALGWPNVLVAIILAYLIGSVVSIGLVLSGKKKWGSQIPLGIFLSTATIITLFWGEEILSWYLNILF